MPLIKINMRYPLLTLSIFLLCSMYFPQEVANSCDRIRIYVFDSKGNPLTQKPLDVQFVDRVFGFSANFELVTSEAGVLNIGPPSQYLPTEYGEVKKKFPRRLPKPSFRVWVISKEKGTVLLGGVTLEGQCGKSHEILFLRKAKALVKGVVLKKFSREPLAGAKVRLLVGGEGSQPGEEGSIIYPEYKADDKGKFSVYGSEPINGDCWILVGSSGYYGKKEKIEGWGREKVIELREDYGEKFQKMNGELWARQDTGLRLVTKRFTQGRRFFLTERKQGPGIVWVKFKVWAFNPGLYVIAKAGIGPLDLIYNIPVAGESYQGKAWVSKGLRPNFYFFGGGVDLLSPWGSLSLTYTKEIADQLKARIYAKGRVGSSEIAGIGASRRKPLKFKVLVGSFVWETK